MIAQLLFWAAMVVTFIVALMPHPLQVPGHPSDKLEHMFAFATLGLLAGLAYPRLGALQLIVGLSLFGGLIEILQGTALIHRDRDVLDWIADTVACAVVIAALRWWRARKH